MDDDGGLIALTNGVLTGVHPPSACRGAACWIHDPSEHHMVDWPVRWTDRRTAERVCSHDIGHPDPDDVAYHRRQNRDTSIHGCDGCCGMLPPGLITWRIGAGVERLAEEAGGRWLVTTEYDEHVLDLDDGTHYRIPLDDDATNYDARRHRIVRVLRWPVVGERFAVVFEGQADAPWESTTVESIEPLERVDE